MPRTPKAFPALLLTVLLIVLLAVLTGCASAPRQASPHIPSGAALVSPQTPPSPVIAQAAQAIPGKTDLERLQNAMKYVGEHLAYDPSGNATQFDRTAPQIFTDMTLGGCSEFALAQLALVRAMGYPDRLRCSPVNASGWTGTATIPFPCPTGTASSKCGQAPAGCSSTPPISPSPPARPGQTCPATKSPSPAPSISGTPG